jgi:hypothetical protein
VDKQGYLEKLGGIGWPAMMTRPEIAHIHSLLGQMSMYPTRMAHEAALHVIGYLANTENMGPVYGGRLRVPLGLSEMPAWFEESRGVFTATDSSWGKQPKPYGGHVVMRANGPIGWSSKAFKLVVPQSTAEAETAQAAKATRMTLAVRLILAGLRREVKGPTALLGDNSAMMDIVKKDGTTERSRYFERTTMFVKYAAIRLLIETKLVPTDTMIADIFTKCVDNETFLRMRHELLNMEGDAAYADTHRQVAQLVRSLQKMVRML